MNRADDPAGPRTTAVHGRVLVACGDSMDFSTLAALLERQGLEVHGVYDGPEAIMSLQTTAFDLVLLDARLPEAGGHAVLQQLKQSPATRDIPVLILTGEGQMDEAVRCIESGAEDHLPKPFHPVLLRARTGACLERKALGEAGLRHLRAMEETRMRLQRELSEAARYVRSILPEPVETPFRIDWKHHPSSEIGGDAFGYHWIDDEHFAIYLLDVCGHGVAASLLSVTAINLIRSGSLPHTDFRDPSAVLTALNEAFPMERQNEMYFTIWYGVYHAPTRRLTYCSGGHPPALLLSSGESQRLHALGMIIGAVRDSRYQSRSCEVPGEAILLVLCDGCYEIRDAGGSMMAFDEFETFMSQNARDPNALGKLVAWVKKRQGGGRFLDDFSIVRIRF